MRPLTVTVLQAAAVCHIVVAPLVPLACIYRGDIRDESSMANKVDSGLPFRFTAKTNEVPVGSIIAGGAGTLARVKSESATLRTVSTLSPFLAFTRKVYSVFGIKPVTVLAVLVASVSQRASVCQTAPASKVPSA